MIKKILILLSLCSVINLNASIIFKYSGNIYDIKLNKNEEIESNINDYLNILLSHCKMDSLNKVLYNNGIFSLPSSDITHLCKELLNIEIDLLCYFKKNNYLFIIDNKIVNLSTPIPYLSIMKKDFEADNLEVKGLYICYLNNIFKENKMEINMILSFKINKDNINYQKMRDPLDKDKKVNVATSVLMIPKNKGFQPEPKIIILK